ncbi:MAG TPA: DegT/DnrJ/EryC1/StrS family aminotransferase [Alphaproteobacteria bacterium]|jgi:dTDP-4-amino-4,6-dideoxygalactose transaminase
MPETPPRQIAFARPFLDDATREAVLRVLSGTTLVHGPVTHEFELRFAARAGARNAISVSSCTAGLHLGLFVEGIGAGDRVAMPAITHVATAHAARFCGADPLFVDVEPDTGNLDAAALAAALAAHDRVKAVIVVHFLGLPCDMDAINAAASKGGAFVEEDCAIALDATYGGRKAGTLGRLGCFSFYPTKHMTTIEGGMVTTDDDALAAKIRARRAFGYDRGLGERARPGIYDVNALGYNYRMNEVEAAVGLAQMAHLDTWQDARARNYRGLRNGLAELDEVTVFAPQKGSARSSYFCLNAVLPRDGSVSRDLVIDRLKARGVGTSVHYPKALPLMSYYRERYGYRPGQFPVAEWLGDQSISLPVGPHIGADDIRYIVSEFKEAVRRARR